MFRGISRIPRGSGDIWNGSFSVSWKENFIFHACALGPHNPIVNTWNMFTWGNILVPLLQVCYKKLMYLSKNMTFVVLRSVTRLLKTIEKMKTQGPQVVGLKDGKDFLFLFDLLAHTCGLESTLRVLTHSDEKFYQICKPNIDLGGEHLTLEEDKLKIVWKPADIER